MKSKRVGTIVVTFNRKKMLKECIESLLKQSYDNQEILIIDNASTDGTADYIKKLIDNKKVFYFNTGQIKWLSSFQPLICISQDALKILVDKAAYLKDDFSFLAGLVKWTDGSLCSMNIPKLDETGWHDKYDLFKEDLIPIESSTFVSFFANVKYVKEVGLPIKEFFIYGDDWEYSLRLHKKAQSYLVPSSVMTHKMASNSKSDIVDCPAERIDRCYYDYRNRAYVVRLHGAKKDRIKYRVFYFSFILNILKRSPDHKWKRIRTLTKGYIKGHFFKPKIEME